MKLDMNITNQLGKQPFKHRVPLLLGIQTTAKRYKDDDVGVYYNILVLTPDYIIY